MDRHRDRRTQHTPYMWLAAGAVTLGVGAGLASGAGVAQADTGPATHEPAAPRPRAEVHERVSRQTPPKPRTAAARTLSAAKTAPAVASALSVPGLPSLPSPGVVVQQAINVLTTVVNNTPIRGVLDAIAPVSSTSGVSAIRLPGSPVGTAMSADGSRVFVTTAPITAGWLFPLLPTAYSVTEIDTKTNTIVGIPIAVEGGVAGAVALSPDGERAFLTTSAGNGSRVTVINTTNGGVVNAVNLPGNASGLTYVAPDGHVFIETGSYSSLTITVLDGRTGTPAGTPAQVSGFSSGRPAFSGDRGYVTTWTNTGALSTTSVTVIDATDNSIIRSIAIDGQPESYVGGVVISPDGALGAQSTYQPGIASTITLFDLDTGAIIGSPIPLDGVSEYPAVFSGDGSRFSVVSGAGTESRLTVIDTTTGLPVAAPILLAGSTDPSLPVVFGPNGDLFYVASRYIDDIGKPRLSVLVVNATDGTAIGSPLVLDGDPRGLSIAPDGRRAFQTLNGDSGATVSVVGIDGSLVAPTIPLAGWGNRSVAFSADGSRAYQATSGLTSMVTAIDANTGSVIGNQVSITGDLGDELFVRDENSVYSATRVTLFEFVVPIPLPFPMVFSVESTHVNAIDATSF